VKRTQTTICRLRLIPQRKAERASHTAARKVVYEALQPSTKQGGAPGKAGGGKKPKDAESASFAEDTAQKTGKAVRTVQVDAKRGSGIGAAVIFPTGISLLFP
jgi:hypothetical protein